MTKQLTAPVFLPELKWRRDAGVLFSNQFKAPVPLPAVRLHGAFYSKETIMDWLKILNISKGEKRKARLVVDGVIGGYNWLDGSGVTANEFIETVDALGELDDIHIDINSPGGIFTDGIAMTNYLINHKASVSMNVIGEASCIASVFVQAADPGKLHMGIGTTMFIHDPVAAFQGDADEFREVADILDAHRDAIIEVYRSRNKKLSSNKIRQLMKDDTLLSATDAVSFGFADSTEHLRTVACADRSKTLRLAQNAVHASLVKYGGTSRRLARTTLQHKPQRTTNKDHAAFWDRVHRHSHRYQHG